MPGTRSLFEKLTDEDTSIPFEMEPKKISSFSAFQKSIAEDLSRLLNTRLSIFWRNFTDHNYFVPYAYGVNITPEISSESVSDIYKLEQRIKKAIEQTEPRLSCIKVQIQNSENNPTALLASINAVALFDDQRAFLSFPMSINL